MQEDVKEGVSWKSSFTSGNVHDDGYLFLLQQHSAQTGYFVRIRNVTKRTLKDKIKRRGKGDGDGSSKTRTYQHCSTSAQLQEFHKRARWPDRSF